MAACGRCILEFCYESRPGIELNNGESFVLGRNPKTKIKDVRCSKEHVKLVPDVLSRTVLVQQLGRVPCEVNGKRLMPKDTTFLKEGDTLFILEKKYPVQIKFIDDTSPKSSPSVKRKLSPAKSPGHRRAKKMSKSDSPVQGQDSDFDEAEEDERLKRIQQNLQLVQKTLMEIPVVHKAPGTNEPSKASANSLFNAVHSEVGWKTLNSLMVYNSPGLFASSKVASFDVDGTIITTKSGKVFPVDIKDWKLLFPEIKPRLRKLHQEGYKVVFFTNQMGISKGRVNVNQYQDKVQNIIAELAIPVQVLVSMKDGLFRKPAPGMWDYLTEQGNEDITVDTLSSFFVGDAAGREEKWAFGKKKDFAIGDRLFAINTGLKFHTPEEYFLGWKPAPFKMPKFDPTQIKPAPLSDPPSASLTSLVQEVIVFVGFPASGKSHFAELHLAPNGYQIVSRDELKYWQRCVEACDMALVKGKKVVIDNTNPDRDSRRRYVMCANRRNVTCRCFVFNVTLEQAKHNNKFRHLTTTSKTHIQVNDMVLHQYGSKFQEPKLDEGFTEIVLINFVPTFKDPEKEKLYRMFLLEK